MKSVKLTTEDGLTVTETLGVGNYLALFPSIEPATQCNRVALVVYMHYRSEVLLRTHVSPHTTILECVGHLENMMLLIATKAGYPHRAVWAWTEGV